MRFTDPRSAGLALAAKLEVYGGREQTIVLALARGGVAVGLEVSKRLGLPLDLILLRRLLVPRGPDSPVCALSVGGALFVDEELDEEVAACNEPALEHFVADALAELDARVRACRGERPPIELKDKTVIVVDNGIRTGSTMRTAVRALRSKAPARVVAAVPVADDEARAGIEAAVEDFVCLASPKPFGHVGLWYADFRRPGDDEIRAMLEESERSV
ncbi:MAG: putative phosphoribosyl transferase [Acidobacteriota bacterium]|jgi:putative phosphoribosyl transferase|nr:putative phosphoribosyl transferase [Acidobacteriota bacterium]